MKVYLLQENDYDVYSAWGIYSSIDAAKEALLNKHKNIVDMSETHSGNDLLIHFSVEYPVQDRSIYVKYTYNIVEYTLDEALEN